jgi:nucleoside-diphosphate-sugar epimerase
MRVVVTGAAGYIGTRLVRTLLGDSRLADARFVLCDTAAPVVDDRRVEPLAGDLREPDHRRRALAGGSDVVFHLAGILGGAAETNYDLARSVNVEATFSLLEELRNERVPPRVIYASTIAVFGPPLPASVDDDSFPLPAMSYGAQKLAVETLLGQFSRRGWIDGIALRLPGIVARTDADARMKSAFLNRLFHDYAAGRPIVLPVSAQATTWLLSVGAAIDALVHAAFLPSTAIGPVRSMNLTTQRVAINELVAALARRFPDSRSTVEYAPDPDLEAQFGRFPPIATPLADRLGFCHDGDIDTLVERALEG